MCSVPHLHTAALRAGEGQEVGAKTEMKGPVKEEQTKDLHDCSQAGLHTCLKQSNSGCCQREPTKGLFTDVPSLFTAQINRRGAHSSYLIKAAKKNPTKTPKPRRVQSDSCFKRVPSQQLLLSFLLLCGLVEEAQRSWYPLDQAP